MLTRLYSWNIWAHLGLTAVAFGGFQLVKARLDASYAASNHPVDYATGQLAFDAEKIEGYYATMIEAGTLNVYWQTQFIDFGFIFSVMALSALLGTLAGRSGRPGSLGRRIGVWAGLAGIAGASFDALENLLSFAMLARPSDIAPALAVLYSSAAAVKFALLTLAMALVLVALAAGLVSRLRAAPAA